MNKLTEIEKAYLSGFFDGEGSVSIVMAKPSRWQGRSYHVLRLLIGNTSLDILEWVKSVVGIGHVYKYEPRLEGRKPCYHYKLSGMEAMGFLENLLPYLKVKKRVAELSIEFQKTKNRKSWGSKRVPQDIWNIRERIKEEMSRLNAKGLH